MTKKVPSLFTWPNASGPLFKRNFVRQSVVGTFQLVGFCGLYICCRYSRLLQTGAHKKSRTQMRLNVIECMRNGCWRSVHNIVLFCKMCAIAYCTYCIMSLNNKLSSRT